MLYDVPLPFLSFSWVVLAIVAAVAFGSSVRFGWIRGGVLVTFLVLKLSLGLGMSIWSVLADVEFDAAGYYVTGSTYAGMIQDLVIDGNLGYIHNTPFFWIDGSSTDRFTSLTGLFLLLTGNSFLGATVIACLLGAVGQLLLYRFFRERFPRIRDIYFLPVLFHPSCMLWSGMLLKDSLGIFALGGAVYSLHRSLGARQLLALVPLALNLYIVYLFRSFIFLPLAAFIFFMVWDLVVLPYASRQSEGYIMKILYLLASATACILLLWFLVDRFGDGLVEESKSSTEIYAQLEAGSSFENMQFSLSPRGILALAMGAFNSLLRPFPWDVRKLIQGAAALENLVVLGYVLTGFNCYVRRLTSRQRDHFSGAFWGMLATAMIIAMGVGLFASNSGTISRYRIPMIPFLLAVPGMVLGMADRFARETRGYNGGNFRQRFDKRLEKPRST